MTSTDRDLVTALRAELAAIEPSRPCDRAAERAGLDGGSALVRDPLLARLGVRLARHEPHLEPRRDDGHAESGALAGGDFRWEGAREHCRLAYLRGRFLAHGSLSLAGGRTHLEFVVGTSEAPVLAQHLGEEGMPASWRVRRGRGVVTWKSAETVSLFLRRIGAGAALLELEARQVSRALRGELNRVLNAESANLQRSVEAAGRQLAAIDVLEADGRLAAQPYAVRVAAAARREAPEATLTDLAERAGLHRSAIQRALDRIERLAQDQPEGAPLA